ncbi:MAG: Anaerobic ribonucleoside-triphosphate reductase [Parcubacteria bacterium 32_520]|nr:MAG: Anaerobic ribonucleoside-triphosphate reductase [Parcubacteria bacterium 33_209]KUK99193.1 MAG: Anaerobic ribonucleoside-triphosphate reductase [Parcubacteria bacterium 32_520]
MAVDYNQIAKNLSQKGYEPLKQVSVVPTEITGTMNKLLDIVRTGEYAAGGVLSGVGVKKGIKQKISPSDALGITNTATRLIADIFLDPTTYLTFGAGGGVKITTKTGVSITLTKAGTREFVSLSKKIGAEKARKEFAEILVRNPNYIDKSGLKFMGQTIIPKKSFDAIGSTVKNTIVKVPYVDKLGNVAEKTVDMFNPLAKLSKDTEAGQFATKYNLFLKSTRAQEYRTIEAIAKAEKQYIKKHGKEFAKNVSKYIEDGDSLLKMPASMVDDVKRVGDEIISIQNKIAKEELALGILKSTLGADKFVKAPKVVKNIVEKYTDDIFTGAIKTADEFKKTLTRKESEALKNLYKQGNKKYTAGKIFNIISNSYITPDNYIRHVLTEKGRKFLEKEGSFMNALPKPLRVKLRAGDMRKMGGTIDEINKVMRSKVGGDLFEPDAFKALAYRRGESIRAIETYKFLDEVKKSSYAVKALPGEVSRNIDGIKYIRSTNKQLEGRLFPEPIVRELDKTVEFLTGDKATKEFLSGYDKLLTFWKGSVTGWFPAFHTRNFIGGTFNNWLSRMNPKYYKMSVDLQRDLKKGGNKIWVSATGETFTSKQLIKIIEDSGAINQPGMVDVMKKVEDIVGSTKMKQLGNYPKILLEGVENNLRIPLFMDRFLGRGYSAADAAKDVFKFHFDYAPEGLTAFERNVMKRMIPFYCVSDDTECLTDSGWKLYNQINPEDRLLTYNLKTKELEWQNHNGIYSFDYNGHLIHFKTQNIDLKCTLNHRCITEEEGIKEAIDVGFNDHCPMVGKNKNKDFAISDKILSLIGWVITDGHYRRNGSEICIYQKKYNKEIEKLLSDNEYSVRIHPKSGVSQYSIIGDTRKEIQKWFQYGLWKLIIQLSVRQLELFKNVVFLAEGNHGYEDSNKKFNFIAQQGKYRDLLQLIWFLSGMNVKLGERGFYERKFQSTKYRTKNYEWFNGRVWCPSTPNTTAIFRRNGIITISGQTWTRNNIPLQIEQMIKQPGKYAMFPKLQQDIGGKIGEEEFQDLPEWMQNMMVVRIREEGGSGLWLQLNLPIEDLNKLPLNPEGVREIVSMMSPILKVPTEIITNRNLFFGTEIVNPDLPKELQTAKTIKQLKMLPEPIKDFLNFKEMQYKGKDGWETRYEMDAVKLHILKGAIGRFYDTIGKAFDEDVDAKRKMLRLIGGLPVYDVDIKEQRYWDTYEKQKEEKAIEGYYRIRRFEE